MIIHDRSEEVLRRHWAIGQQTSLVKTNIDGDTGVLHELELPREDGTDNPGHGGQCGLFETSIQVTLLKSVYVPD